MLNATPANPTEARRIHMGFRTVLAWTPQVTSTSSTSCDSDPQPIEAVGGGVRGPCSLHSRARQGRRR